jgi:hypothetical protein
MSRVEFNDQWLRTASLKRIREVFKSDKILLNLALERKKQLTNRK